ncbi:ABC-F family ATP-binding cassette domain-containing protein [Candidatus Paracaedibacter symbiosus]|uniref:ABC-F family ATP-binding cassette domain-containing protein n=1 Tax=Candidatus Paracaedibacter symbiosus TaxID=244582 RepID=UPI0006911AF0|nr:ABC-F family ATP-binding cassette domain-containing protein [Candidatus Paracaedibacter symbiosus]
MILIQNLTKKFGHRFILDNINYHFPEGERIALVGANGAGKSTLLNIICNLDEAESGQLIKPKKMVLGYLPQEPNPTPKDTILEECLEGSYALRDLERRRDAALELMGQDYTDEHYFAYEKLEAEFQELGGYGLSSDTKGLLIGLGFTQDHFDRSPLELSGGWRMRLELAKVLINKPDFLILDEPTNHLDLPSLIWLEQFLQTFKGTLLFVSHDRDLLNRLATITLHLFNQKLTPYKGNFDAFLDQYEQRQLLNANEVKNIQNRYADIEKFVDRFRAKQSKAAQVRSRLKMLSRLRSLEESVQIDQDPSEVSIQLSNGNPSGKHVLNLKEVAIGYTKPLAKKLSLKIDRGQKIAIIGANGIGKSTLLKSIIHQIPFLMGQAELGHNVRIGYHAQEQLDYLDEKKTALENVLAINPEISEQRARSLLGGFLLRGDDVFKKLSILSGGEKNRVGLCCLIVQNANFLLLDEPTNHLDMSSANILANALGDYEGTVLFVSHNRAFINDVATHIFAMTADGRGGLFEGTLADYESQALSAGFPNVLKAD